MKFPVECRQNHVWGPIFDPSYDDICKKIYILYIYVHKKDVFINMVITWVKNVSPDMILTAFDRKFHEKKDEIPPGACRPPYASNYSILGI